MDPALVIAMGCLGDLKQAQRDSTGCLWTLPWPGPCAYWWPPIWGHKEVETKSSSSIRFTVHKLQVYHTSFFLLSFHMDLFIDAKRVARPCNDMDPREHERRQSWAVMLYLPFSWTDSAASDAEYPRLALSSTSTSTFAPTLYPGTAWEQPWSTFPPKTGACTQLWPPATSQTWHLCFNVEGDLWTNCSGEREISQPWLTDG